MLCKHNLSRMQLSIEHVFKLSCLRVLVQFAHQADLPTFAIAKFGELLALFLELWNAVNFQLGQALQAVFM